MPTKYRRIPVTNDPELADALARVRSQFEGAPTAKVVHDLAVKGAQALELEQRSGDEAIERLVTLSTERLNRLDWDVLENIDELAWGD